MLANRCAAVLFLMFLAVTAGLRQPAAFESSPVSIGITPVFLTHKTRFLNEWQAYLERRLGQPVRFIQRSTYREVMDLLLDGQLDFAWICGYPYVRHRDELRLMAVPLYRGEPLYQSYLIVPRTDGTTTGLAQLEGRIFAYSDPDSNSGYLVPQYELRQLGVDPKQFFKKSFFTWAHDKVVKAVASGLADGGAVDGYVWDTLALINPQLTGRTRVVSKSGRFGFPPVVARNDIGSETFARMRHIFLKMDRDPAGQALLKQLNLDGFVDQDPGLFDGISHMVSVFSAGKHAEEPEPALQDPS